MKFFYKIFYKGSYTEKAKLAKISFFVIIILNKSNVIDFFTKFLNSITLPIKLKKGQLHYQM